MQVLTNSVTIAADDKGRIRTNELVYAHEKMIRELQVKLGVGPRSLPISTEMQLQSVPERNDLILEVKGYKDEF